MSLEFMDGFDAYNTAANLLRKWDATSGSISSMPAGRFGGLCLVLQQATHFALLTSSQLAALTTRTVGFAFQSSSLAATHIFFAFRDGTTTQLDLRMTTSGTIQVTRAGTVLATSTNTATINTWYYVEFQAVIDPAAGSFTLKVDGVTWATASGVNTRNTANSSMNGLAISGNAANLIVRFDDLYVLNPSGSVNNDFLGECRILTSLPTGDNTTATGTNKLWTPNAGTTHYTQVDEASPDDDTTYVSSSTAGQIDTYTFPSIAPTGDIAAVQVVLTDRKDDAGARTICAEYRGGGSNYDGANMTPGSAYLMHRQVWETDPATGLAWTAAGINSGEWGVKVIA